MNVFKKHKNSKFINARTVAYISIYLAIMIIFSFTPQLGYVNIGITSFTTLVIPVTIMTVHYGPRGAMFAWVFFGILYFLQVFISFAGVLGVIGWGGAVVVYLFGKLATGLILTLISFVLEQIEKTKNISKRNSWITIKIITLAILGSVLNGFIFMLLWYIMDSNHSSEMMYIFLTNFGIAFAIEIPLTIIICTAAIPLIKYLKQTETNYEQNSY